MAEHDSGWEIVPQSSNQAVQTDSEIHFCILLGGVPVKIFHSKDELDRWIANRCTDPSIKNIRNGDCIRRYQGQICTETITIKVFED